MNERKKQETQRELKSNDSKCNPKPYHHSIKYSTLCLSISSSSLRVIFQPSSSQPVVGQEVSDHIERARSVLVKVDMMTSPRMQSQLQRLRILVQRLGRLLVDARAVPIADDVVALTSKMQCRLVPLLSRDADGGCEGQEFAEGEGLLCGLGVERDGGVESGGFEVAVHNVG